MGHRRGEPPRKLLEQSAPPCCTEEGASPTILVVVLPANGAVAPDRQRYFLKVAALQRRGAPLPRQRRYPAAKERAAIPSQEISSNYRRLHGRVLRQFSPLSSSSSCRRNGPPLRANNKFPRTSSAPAAWWARSAPGTAMWYLSVVAPVRTATDWSAEHDLHWG